MTAEEIRKHDIAGLGGAIAGQSGQADAAVRIAIFLREIAAQLAELNANLSPAAKVEAERLTAQIKGHF